MSLRSVFAFAQETSTTTQALPSGKVEIFVEPLSYIPPFYKGLPLFSNEGTVKIFAFTDIAQNGQSVSSDNLSFKWTENGIVLGSESGLGKNVLMIDSALMLKAPEINLDVLDSDGNLITSASLIVNINNPQVLFYQNSPLYGVLFNNSLNNGFNLGTNEELNVMAKPFFFSVPSDISGDLNYSWSVNGSAVNYSGQKNSLLLRQTTQGQSGVSSVSLDINDSVNDFQSASGNFNVSFGK